MSKIFPGKFLEEHLTFLESLHYNRQNQGSCFPVFPFFPQKRRFLIFQFISSILSILPLLSKLTQKKAAVPSKPQANKPLTRTLRAEPLEERLPISSSAAGVLFGYGITHNEPGVERSATPGYEALQTFRTSVTQQPALDIFELNPLDLQLDALAVDLFYREESLLDTISAASEDPFVLTPQTPGIDLGDTTTDVHRELGDELLLFQISTLNFTRYHGDTMTPERTIAPEGPVTPSSKAKAPDSLTIDTASVYTLRETESAPSQGTTRLEESPRIVSMNFSPSSPPAGIDCIGLAYIANGSRSACYAPQLQGGYDPLDQTLYVFSSGNSIVIDVGFQFSTPSSQPGTVSVVDPEECWTTNTASGKKQFIWTKPQEKMMSEVQNNYTFHFVIGSAAVDLKLHIGWAEVFVSFGQLSELHQSNVKSGDTKTQDNTLIVGQQLFAVPSFDGAFSYVDNSIQWSTPTGGNLVRNYIPSPTTGEIVPLTSTHLKQYTFEGYYYNKSANIGSISASFKLKDPNGFVHNVVGSASYFLEAAECTSFTSSWAPLNGVAGPHVTRWLRDPNNSNSFAVGLYGITFDAAVKAPIFGDGEVAMMQTVKSICTKDDKPGSWNTDNYALDKTVIYSTPASTRKQISANATQTMYAEDAPGSQMHTAEFASSTKHSRNDTFRMYVMYKPSGASIWVSLAALVWGVKFDTVKNTTNPSVPQYPWEIVANSGVAQANLAVKPYYVLPTWTENITNVTWK